MPSFGIAFTLLGIVGGCADATGPACLTPLEPASAVQRATIDQGLAGVVLFWEGDFMPGTGRRGEIRPVQRTLHVYELTHYTQAEPHFPGWGGPFYDEFETRRVAAAQSDRCGFFEIALAQGRYTLVVVEDGQLFAAVGDGRGNINPVDVVAGEVQVVQFDITHSAAF